MLCRAIAKICIVFICLLFAVQSTSAQTFEIRLADPVWVGRDLAVQIKLTSSVAGVQAFQMGVCISNPGLAATGMTLLPILEAMNGGQGPELFMFEVDPVGGSGITCGTVFATNGSITMGPFNELPLIEMTYNSESLPFDTTIHLEFCDTLGLGPTVTQLTVNGQNHPMTGYGLDVYYVQFPEKSFIRCDSNGSGSLDIADGITALDHLFGGSLASCHSSLDCNGDNSLDIADVIKLLDYVFGSGTPPVAPYPGCALATSQLSCASPSCP